MKTITMLILLFSLVFMIGCSSHPKAGDWYERKEDRQRFQVLKVSDEYVEITNSTLRNDMNTPETSLHIRLTTFKEDYTLVQ
jgi:hypothetical protein